MQKSGKAIFRAAEQKRPATRVAHRLLGVAAGWVLLWLALTGLPLQFASQLELGSRFVSLAPILDLYNIPAPVAGARADHAVLIADTLFYNEEALVAAHGLTGSAQLDDFVVVGLDDELLIFPQDEPGTRERLPVPEGIRRLGTGPGGIWLETTAGHLLLDENLTLQPAEPGAHSIRWSTVTPLTGAELSRYSQLARSRILTVERLLQDFHSGRVAGPIGEWVISLGALALLVLAATGLWIWWKTR